nr:hypothetical protein [Nocardia carnea]
MDIEQQNIEWLVLLHRIKCHRGRPHPRLIITAACQESVERRVRQAGHPTVAHLPQHDSRILDPVHMSHGRQIDNRREVLRNRGGTRIVSTSTWLGRLGGITPPGKDWFVVRPMSVVVLPIGSRRI